MKKVCCILYLTSILSTQAMQPQKEALKAFQLAPLCDLIDKGNFDGFVKQLGRMYQRYSHTLSLFEEPNKEEIAKTCRNLLTYAKRREKIESLKAKCHWQKNPKQTKANTKWSLISHKPKQKMLTGSAKLLLSLAALRQTWLAFDIVLICTNCFYSHNRSEYSCIPIISLIALGTYSGACDLYKGYQENSTFNPLVYGNISKSNGITEIIKYLTDNLNAYENSKEKKSTELLEE